MSTPLPQNNRVVKIKVSITRRPGHNSIVCNLPLPSIQKVVSCLTSAQQAQTRPYLSSYSRLDSIITACTEVRTKAWVSAIAKALAQDQEDTKSCDVELLAVKGPAYLALGNAVFRLEATDFITSGERALVALRRQITDVAKDECSRIKDLAQNQAREIVDAARSESYTIQNSVVAARLALSAIRTEVAELRVPPAWATENGLTMCWQGSTFKIAFTVSVCTKYFYYEINDATTGLPIKHIWDSRSKAYITLPLWIPVSIPDGDINIRQITLDITHFKGTCPHINTGGSCMKAGDAPTSLRSYADLAQLEATLERVLTEVNMASLLSPYRLWNPKLKRAVPSVLLPLFNNGIGITEVMATANRRESESPATFFCPTPTQPPTQLPVAVDPATEGEEDDDDIDY